MQLHDPGQALVNQIVPWPKTVDLPIVLSTGLISEELRKAAKEAGICEVFPKERSFEDLATLLGCIQVRQPGV